MPLGNLTGVLPPDVAHEALRLFFEILGKLDVVSANGGGVLFALRANPQLADDLSAIGAAIEDDEDDGCAEDEGRALPSILEGLLAPAPRLGHPVPPWSPPDLAMPGVRAIGADRRSEAMTEAERSPPPSRSRTGREAGRKLPRTPPQRRAVSAV